MILEAEIHAAAAETLNCCRLRIENRAFVPEQVLHGLCDARNETKSASKRSNHKHRESPRRASQGHQRQSLVFLPSKKARIWHRLFLFGSVLVQEFRSSVNVESRSHFYRTIYSSHGVSYIGCFRVLQHIQKGN